MSQSTTRQPEPVILITGAARRIGAAIAHHMHSAGYKVIIHCHQSLDAAQLLCAELNTLRPDSAVYLQAELGDIAQVKNLAKNTLECWGRLDGLVNNASSFYPTPLADANEADWDTLIASNLKAPYFLSQSLAKALKETQGSIVNIADIHARQPLANHSIYCIAKAGNLMLTKTLAKELAPTVRVNGIAPGAILWPEKSHQPDSEINDLNKQNILNKIPLGRLGDAQDIARLVYFLTADASYINGQTIAVDGGSHLN